MPQPTLACLQRCLEALRRHLREPPRRKRNIHNVGNKRELIPDECCWPDYVSIPGRAARRCHELIRTLPALNNYTAFSRPRMPEGLDERIGDKVEEQEEQGGDRGGV